MVVLRIQAIVLQLGEKNYAPIPFTFDPRSPVRCHFKTVFSKVYKGPPLPIFFHKTLLIIIFII